MHKVILFFFIVLFALPCQRLSAQLFELQNAKTSGINFYNKIEENKEFNILNYMYIYNGSGAAIADFNNDGLQDIFFAGYIVYNHLYLNKGNFKFEEIAEKSGLKAGNGINTGVAVVDINNDGWQDIYICNSVLNDIEKRRNQLFINNGDLTFTNKAKEYGLDDPSFSNQAYFADFDNDGDVDLYLLNHPSDMVNMKKIELTYNKAGELEVSKPKNTLYFSDKYYENQNGKFIDKTKSAGIENYSYGLSAAVADFNKDGFLDVYVANDFSQPDYLYINNKDGTFTDKIDDYFTNMTNNSMGTFYADVNNDGLSDLLELDMLPEDNFRQKQFRVVMSYDQFEKLEKYKFKKQYIQNSLQINKGKNYYGNIAFALDMAFTDWSWCPLIADFDNNTHKDIYITNGFYRDINNHDVTKFKLDEIIKQMSETKNPDEVEKLLNQFQSVKISNYYFANQGHFQFVKNLKESGLLYPSWSNGACYGDLDNDGDLDLVVSNHNQASFVFKNQSSEKNLGNYMRFKLVSKNGNASTYGTQIQLSTPDKTEQSIYYYPNMGYMCTNEPYIHFGLAKNTSAQVKVVLKNGLSKIFSNLQINKVHEINIDEINSTKTAFAQHKTFFKDITSQCGINFIHKENYYNDFKQEPLIPKRFSKLGPSIAVGDINNDKLDDIFIGSSAKNTSQIYLQNSNGSFTIKTQNVFETDNIYEDGQAVFFDFDKDGDADLLVSSGGNDYPNDMKQYPLRLYINDGKGGFSKADENVMPKIFISSNSLCVFDYNKDGYEDVFVAAYTIPGHYGKIPKSYLLQNKQGKFNAIDDAENVLSLGMISDVKSVDLNGDTWPDLVMLGEWMPITFWLNNKGHFEKKYISQLEDSKGWWTKIFIDDLSGNGKKEFVFGNYGINTKYKSNGNNKMKMKVSDFDKNGSTDAFIGTFIKDDIYPSCILDNLTDQMPYLKKRYNRYEKFSNKKFNEVFNEQEILGAQTFEIDNMQSVYGAFDQNNKLNFNIMPFETNLFTVKAINAFDIDHDGDKDLLISGNDANIEIESGSNDAGSGQVLLNVGNNLWQPIYHSGYFTPHDVKNVIPILINNKPCWIVATNSGPLKILQLVN